MSENKSPTYVAIISLTIPGAAEQFNANVTLLPEDTIPAEGHFKRLQECTLADLQAYAEALEADVWETYQEIQLVDLARTEEVQVDLTIQDEAGEALKPDGEWLNSVVVTLTLPEPKKADPDAAASEMEAIETPPAETDRGGAETTEESGTPAVTLAGDSSLEEAAIAGDEAEESAEDAEPEIIVAESEPIYDEPEADETLETPTIAPSRARVRLAGKRRPLGDKTWAAVDILIEEPALRAAQAHALSSMNREVAGVLVGPPPEKQPDGRYVVHIHDTIIAKYTVMHGASVTYTPESWRYMNDVLHERYPDDTAVMVGWYHTHPGFGIFLSGMDLFIHQNFFTQLWHVAFVLDPRARASGFFSWDRPKSEVQKLEFPWPAWASRSW